MKLVTLLMLCLMMAGCSLVIDSAYDTLEEADEAEMIGKGWVPEWVPRDATKLHEVHDLDSNTSQLSFFVPPGTGLNLPPDCRPVAYAQTSPAVFNRLWWPGDRALERSYRFLQCNTEYDKAVFVAINNDGGRVLYWRTYPR